MPKFSEEFSLGLNQHQLDFVDISNEYDTPVYVDPFAIEICNDIWAEQASEHIRTFFKEVLDALVGKNHRRAANLMAQLHEPSETFLGVSSGEPKGRGLGSGQSNQLINSILRSKAFKTGILSDLSEMTLYVDGVNRDKISDLTTNIIRELLCNYTQQQCALYDIPVQAYAGPPMWDTDHLNWVTKKVLLPRIGKDPIILVPKYIVRRNLSLDSQEFYNKQITDFLVAETQRANDSLAQALRRKKPYKKDVRIAHPHNKEFIANVVSAHPELLETYKRIAKTHKALTDFTKDYTQVNITAACSNLASLFPHISTGADNAGHYHDLVLGSLIALFYPDLIQPHKEWEIHDGRKRIDIVFTNAANSGFFAHRRDEQQVNANTVIIECKNYSSDLANPELDQLIGRFDHNRGKFGILCCRSIENSEILTQRLRDAAARSQGYMIVLTDADLITILEAKANLEENRIEALLHKKYRELLA